MQTSHAVQQGHHPGGRLQRHGRLKSTENSNLIGQSVSNINSESKFANSHRRPGLQRQEVWPLLGGWGGPPRPRRRRGSSHLLHSSQERGGPQDLLLRPDVRALPARGRSRRGEGRVVDGRRRLQMGHRRSLQTARRRSLQMSRPRSRHPDHRRPGRLGAQAGGNRARRRRRVVVAVAGGLRESAGRRGLSPRLNRNKLRVSSDFRSFVSRIYICTYVPAPTAAEGRPRSGRLEGCTCPGWGGGRTPLCPLGTPFPFWAWRALLRRASSRPLLR